LFFSNIYLLLLIFFFLVALHYLNPNQTAMMRLGLVGATSFDSFDIFDKELEIVHMIDDHKV